MSVETRSCANVLNTVNNAGHVYSLSIDGCRLCGACEYQMRKNYPCTLVEVPGQARCVECQLLRKTCKLCTNGPTCAECIDNIRSEGVSLRCIPHPGR